jgi:triacylglycerol lipase
MKHIGALLASLLAAACTSVDTAGGTSEGAPPTTPAASGRRDGVVLAHGLGGSSDSFDPAIVEALRADGYYVLRSTVPPVDSVARRAAALAEQIDGFTAANQLDAVHVVAHSMGGLDTRYLLSTLHGGRTIRSLTTLSTPHRGSPLADLALGLSQNLTFSQQEALGALTSVFGDADPAQRELALRDLAEAHAAEFNAGNPDVADVAYYSYAGYSTLLGAGTPHADDACAAPGAEIPSPSSLPSELQLAGAIVTDGLALRPNDGVVAVESSRWTGFLGCVPADHLDLARAGAKPAEDLDLALVPFFRQIVARAAAR